MQVPRFWRMKQTLYRLDEVHDNQQSIVPRMKMQAHTDLLDDVAQAPVIESDERERAGAA